MCDSCASWTHADCLDISTDEFLVLTKFPNIYWYCDTCLRKSPIEYSENLSDIKNEIVKIDHQISEIKKLDNKFEELKQNFIQLRQESSVTNRLQTSNTQSDASNTNDHHCRIRITGIPESKQKSFIERQFEDKIEVEKILRQIGINNEIKECQRRGKYIPSRDRKVVVTFHSVWDARTAVSKAIQERLFNTNKILITSDLSETDLQVEAKCLKKRYQLIQEGYNKNSLKIRNLKLFCNGSEISLD